VSFTIAATLDEALTALAAGARPVAGGSDLVVGARHGKAPLPDDLVAIDRIEELTFVEISGDWTRIGAGVNHHTIEHHRVLSTAYSCLSDGSALVGSPSTRNVGTIGGNVMNASPAMDTGAPLVVLGAEVELRSVRGSRRIGLAELWTGPGRTSAAPDELCVAIHIPAPAARSNSAYLRLEYRRSMEIAVVGAAASVTIADDGSVSAVRVALTAVAPTIIEVTGLGGGSIAEVAAAAAAAASEQARPISDVRASDVYRRHTVGVMARRAVEAAARRALGDTVSVPVNRDAHITWGIGAAS
jgi:CO/xanthine dehydrogenase FAD-binding subunit